MREGFEITLGAFSLNPLVWIFFFFRQPFSPSRPFPRGAILFPSYYPFPHPTLPLEGEGVKGSLSHRERVRVKELKVILLIPAGRCSDF